MGQLVRLRTLTLTCILPALSGCMGAPLSYTANVASYNRRYARSLWAEWRENEEAAEGKRMERRLDPLSQDLKKVSAQIHELQSRHESNGGLLIQYVDEQQNDLEALEGELQTLKQVRLNLPPGVSVREFVASRNEAQKKELRDEIETAIKKLHGKIEDLSDRLDAELRVPQWDITEMARMQDRENTPLVNRLREEVEGLTEDISKYLKPALSKIDRKADKESVTVVEDKITGLEVWRLGSVSLSGVVAALLGLLWRYVSRYREKIDQASREAAEAKAAVQMVRTQLPQTINATVRVESPPKE